MFLHERDLVEVRPYFAEWVLERFRTPNEIFQMFFWHFSVEFFWSLEFLIREKEGCSLPSCRHPPPPPPQKSLILGLIERKHEEKHFEVVI